MNDEFYIGYEPDMPDRLAERVRRIARGLIAVALVMPGVLVFTEDHVSPNLAELSTYFSGCLRLDGRDFRTRLVKLAEWYAARLPADPELPRPVSRMVVFGDSLSDNGNLKRRLMIFPNSPYWFGRFANGPNWTEYFADRTGLSVQNHAYGGAVAVNHEDVPSESIVASIEKGAQFFLTGSVVNQVKDYRERDLQAGLVQDPDAVGRRLAEELLQQGARQLLA